MCICIYIHEFICIYTCIYIYICISVYIYIYIYIYICISIVYVHIYAYIYIYIYIYRYHTMSDVYTVALLPTKPSFDDDSGFRHGFRAEASLPLTQNTPAVTHDTTRLCWIAITHWDCHIHVDAVMPHLGSFLCISSCLMEKVQD